MVATKAQRHEEAFKKINFEPSSLRGPKTKSQIQ